MRFNCSIFVNSDSEILSGVNNLHSVRVGGEGCEVKYGEWDWRVHVHDASFVGIKLHTVSGGALLKGSEYFL